MMKNLDNYSIIHRIAIFMYSYENYLNIAIVIARIALIYIYWN